MNIFSRSGRQRADNAAVYAADSQSVSRPQGTTAASPPSTRRAFDVRLVSPILSSGKYRVFVERSDVLFIQLEGGSKSILTTIAPLVGPLGNIIPLVLWLFTIREAKTKRRDLETKEPEELLRESQDNFKLNVAEIRDAALEPPSRLVSIGKAGRLNLIVRHGEKIKCEFENAAEMATAIQLLTVLLDSTLRINVVWNGDKRQFEKKKKI